MIYHSLNRIENSKINELSKVFVLVTFKGSELDFKTQFHRLFVDKRYHYLDKETSSYISAFRRLDDNTLQSNTIIIVPSDKVETIHKLLDVYFPHEYILL